MPHYCGPSSPEFTPLTNILLALIEQRFFVTYCQQSEDEHYTNESSDGLRHIQWKSFIEGFVEKGPTSTNILSNLRDVDLHKRIAGTSFVKAVGIT